MPRQENSMPRSEYRLPTTNVDARDGHQQDHHIIYRPPKGSASDSRKALRRDTSTHALRDRHVSFETSHPRTVKEKQPIALEQRIKELEGQVCGLQRKLARLDETIDAFLQYHQSVAKSHRTLDNALREPFKEHKAF